MEAIARQPEAANKIQTAMLIAAALIEGIGFAGVIRILIQTKQNNKVAVGCFVFLIEFSKKLKDGKSY